MKCEFTDLFIICFMSAAFSGLGGSLVTSYFMNKTIDRLRGIIAEARTQYSREKTQAAQKAAETRKNRKAMRKEAAEANAYMKELEKFG